MWRNTAHSYALAEIVLIQAAHTILSEAVVCSVHVRNQIIPSGHRNYINPLEYWRVMTGTQRRRPSEQKNIMNKFRCTNKS